MDEIVIGDERFLPFKKLGKGSYGNVYKVEYEGKFYALKVIQNDPKQGIYSLKELDIMSRLKHPNLMGAELITAEYKKKKERTKLGILMNVADRDLWSAIHDNDLSFDRKISILDQITQGLHFLHHSNYLHLDIKPLNVLLTGENAKLTDFGLSLRMNEDGYVDYPLELMTSDHRSVNVLRGDRRYTIADDIWSLGITFLEVLSGGRSLFSHLKKKDFNKKNVLAIIEDKLSGENVDDTLDRYLKSISKKYRKEIVKLLKKMLEFDPEDRPDTNEILSSPVFSKFRKVKRMERPEGLEGEVVKVPILSPTFCNQLAYEGFDILVRIGTRIPIKLETFFLAADIYQRSLAHRHPLTGDKRYDYNKTAMQAALSLYLAIKMNEAFFADTEKLAELAGNLFQPKDLIIGEAALTNAWGGKFYPNNLFTMSTTTERLIEAFEVSRDCHLYRYLGVPEWGELNDQEKDMEIYPDKWGKFIPFLKLTPYYQYLKGSNREYIEELYEKDKNR